MKYTMSVIINDPNTEDGMNSDLFLRFNVEFSHDENDYGNGYYVLIKGDEGFSNYYDLRYNKDFHAAHKIAWLADWADNYWSGKDGAYKLKSIGITREENDDE